MAARTASIAWNEEILSLSVYALAFHSYYDLIYHFTYGAILVSVRENVCSNSKT